MCFYIFLINLVCNTLHLLTKSDDPKMEIHVGEILVSIAFKLVKYPSPSFVITPLGCSWFLYTCQDILLWPAPTGSFMGDAANSDLEWIAAMNCTVPSPIVGGSGCSHWLLVASNIAWVLLIKNCHSLVSKEFLCYKFAKSLLRAEPSARGKWGWQSYIWMYYIWTWSVSFIFSLQTIHLALPQPSCYSH